MPAKIGRSALILIVTLGLVILIGWTPVLDQLSSRAASYFIQQPIRLSGVRFSYLNGFTFGRVDMLSESGKGLVTGGPGTLFFIPTSALRAKIRISAENMFADYAWGSDRLPWIRSLWPGQKPEALGPCKFTFDLLCGSSGIEMIRVQNFESRGIILQGGVLLRDKYPIKGNLALHLDPLAQERIPKQFTQWLQKNRMPNGNYKISWSQNHLTVRDKTGPRLQADWQ